MEDKTIDIHRLISLAPMEDDYALHFPNQSVFYKFFKAHTGMTPSEYRKG